MASSVTSAEELENRPAPEAGGTEPEGASGGDGAARPEDLVPFLEALLFVADEPVSVDRLANMLMADTLAVQEALEILRRQCESRGLRLQHKGRRVQLVTAPEAAEVIERFLGMDLSSRLSPAALETLAIVAYKQPVTRAEIDAVRGVQSDSVLRTLVSRGLVEEVGRLEQAGRPILYGTTFEFLQYFGLEDLSQLPPLEPDEPAAGAEQDSAGAAKT